MSRIYDQLYIGGAGEASSMEWLKSRDITHIVNCAVEVPSYFPQHFSYLNLNLNDDMNQSLYKVLEKSFEYIRDSIAMSGVVLIHCYAGISRSASILIYFLMKIKKQDFETTLDFVRGKRSIINPNPNFKSQLISVTPGIAKYIKTHGVMSPNHGGMYHNIKGGDAITKYHHTTPPDENPYNLSKSGLSFSERVYGYKK